MTVPVFFDYARTTSNVTLSAVGTAGTQPVQRGSDGVFDVDSASSVVVTWPAGTVAGDLAIICGHHGYNVNVPAGWTELNRTTYGGNHNGAVFYKVLDAADITAGSVTVTFGNSWWGGCTISTFENGANILVEVVANVASSGSGSNWDCPYYSEADRSYILFGSGRSGNVTFDVATSLYTQSASNRYLAYAVIEPVTDGPISEGINWASTSNGYYGILISLTKDGTPGSGLTRAASSAISAASESTRWAVGPLYFEAEMVAKVGTPSVGIVNYFYSFGALTLGTNSNSIAYNSDGTVKLNNATLTTISAYAAGDVVSVAYHPTAKLIWFRVNSGSWNNDGLANPATLTGGIDTSNFVAERVFPAVGFSTGGSIWDGHFSTASFAYSVPTGYNSIEEAVVTTAFTFEDPAAIAAAVPPSPPDVPTDWLARTDYLPTENWSRAVSFPAGPVKTIAGEVQESGVGVEGRLVRLYNKRTGDYVGEARTNASGDFVIPAQDPTLPHFVVAFDDPEYNAKVYDNVLPT